MKLTRLRTISILAVFVCIPCTSAIAAPQEDPQVAKNSGDAGRLTSATPKSADTAKANVPKFLDTATVSLGRIGVQTAQPLPLSLQDVVRRILENNNDVEIRRADVRLAETRYRSQLGIYDPVFLIGPNFSRSNTTGSKATNDFRINSNFSQFMRQGGGNYQAFFNNQRTENAFAQAQVTSGSVSGSTTSAIFSSSLGFSYTQPLLRNFRTDSKRNQIFVARKRVEQSDSDFVQKATDTITQVQRAYWDFVFALRNQQNQIANVNLSRENLRQIEARIEAGAAAPLARAEVETELANREGDLLLATQQVGVAENTLKNLIIKEPLSPEWSQSIVPTDAPKVGLTIPSLDEALKDAMENRTELRFLRIEKEISADNIRFFKNQTKPQLDLNSTFSLDGLSRGGTTTDTIFVPQFTGNDEILRQKINMLFAPGSQIPNPLIGIAGTPSFLVGGFNRSLANIFRSDAPNFSLGVTYSFPLRNRTAKANLEGARILHQQLEAQTRLSEQNVIVEVRNAVQAVETARQRVLTARRARANAEIQLTGEQQLYENGRSTTFILFQRENALTNARNAEIRAETDYSKALADLQRATSTAFRENNITIDTPVPGVR